MKTFSKIAFFTMLAISGSAAYSQCTPDPNLPTWGIFPSVIAEATVNVPYTQVINFKTNIDTNVNVAPFGVLPVKIDSLRILAVLGMPAGFTYQCHNAACIVNGGQPGCTSFTGTPTAAGNYPLEVIIKTSARANIGGGIWVPQSVTDTNKTYSLKVNPVTGTVHLQHSAGLRVYPNPAGSKLFFDGITTNGQTAVHVYDVTGKQVSVENLSQQSIDISALLPGIYFAEVEGGATVLRTKFAKE